MEGEASLLYAGTELMHSEWHSPRGRCNATIATSKLQIRLAQLAALPIQADIAWLTASVGRPSCRGARNRARTAPTPKPTNRNVTAVDGSYSGLIYCLRSGFLIPGLGRLARFTFVSFQTNCATMFSPLFLRGKAFPALLASANSLFHLESPLRFWQTRWRGLTP